MFICFRGIIKIKGVNMIGTLKKLPSGTRCYKGNSITRNLKANYYANKRLNTAPVGAPKLPVLTRIKKFFTSIKNANKNFFDK